MAPIGCRSLQTSQLDVEADVQHVAVLDHVVLPLEALLAPPHHLRSRTRLDEVVPADHLAADEPARDIGVDRRRGVERGLPAAQRPRARLVLGGGEERDQIDRLEQAACDLADGPGRTLPEGRGFLLRQLRELGLELRIEAARADRKSTRLNSSHMSISYA